MNKRGLVFCIQLLIAILFISSSAKAADWRFPLGLTYYSGCIDVVDRYEENLEVEGGGEFILPFAGSNLSE
jgi:hypothetical protein